MFTAVGWAVLGLILIVVVGTAAVIAFVVSGAVGVDALSRLNEPKTDLTCWHCGLPTRAGRRTCQNCGKDLR